jgi:hypothetical protein
MFAAGEHVTTSMTASTVMAPAAVTRAWCLKLRSI